MSSADLKQCLFAGAAIFPAAVLSFGQISTTAFSGTVYGASGAVVVGARVTALNDATGVALTQLTNHAGLYSFPRWPWELTA